VPGFDTTVKSTTGENFAPNPQSRPFASLAISIHLFCVLAVFTANYSRSGLQDRLLSLLAPYTQLLNLDPNFIPFYLTHGAPDDVDQRIEVLPAGADAADDGNWLALSDRGFRGGERYQRYQRLASALGYFAERDEGAWIARGVAVNFLVQAGVKPQQIRCRRHLPQELEAVSGGTPEQRDPFSAAYFREAYRANTLIGDDQRVEILRVEEIGQVAVPDAARRP
jgi:hypothetical protein